MKTLLLISLSVVAGMAFQYSQPFIEPQIVTIDNWQTIDAKRMIQKGECESQKYDIRKELDDKFTKALEERGIFCRQFQTVIESNTNF